jgi:cation diffusion facilitator family transporter
MSEPSKTGAAALSVASNSALILLKAAAGTVTGSVALLTEALHSATDLVASIVALFSLRAADVPADESHPYGHEKIEDMAAAIEGVLILVGSVVIAFEAVRHLIEGTGVQRLGVALVVLAVSIVVNFVVSRRLSTRAVATSSPALAADAAHLTTDMLSSFGVLVALAIVAITGWEWLDPVVALMVAAVVAVAGVRILTRSSRVLVDETLPDPELEAIRAVVIEFADAGIVGFHELRGRQAGARRHVDLHVQFRAGMTLEEAHGIAHRLQAAIRERLGPADVLIHLEPEDRVRPGQEVTTGEPPDPLRAG